MIRGRVVRTGWPFYVRCWRAMKHGTANMDVLIVLGTTTAFAYSCFIVMIKVIKPDIRGSQFFETSAMLIFFVVLGKWLEAKVRPLCRITPWPSFPATGLYERPFESCRRREKRARLSLG